VLQLKLQQPLSSKSAVLGDKIKKQGLIFDFVVTPKKIKLVFK
jgi:hypothetical protein